MKIGIIGLGVVGSACRYGFEKLGHEVFVHDVKLKTNISVVETCEIVYLCVPTPSREDGSCDTSIVESVINDLINLDNFSGYIAIKSTVIPGTTEKLLNVTSRLCFVPEFLRERCAIADFTENHQLLAVGTENDILFNLVVKSHGDYPKNIVRLKPSEAEMLKYYSNVYNAMKVVFSNEIYEICKKLNINYSSVKNAFIKRNTSKDMYLDVNEQFRSYSGQCLVKDTKALDNLCKSLNLDLKLFGTIDSENNKFKKTVFEGMRSE